MTWRTMESAPEKGEFLVWHEGFKEIRTARWFNGRGSPVINSASGRTIRCKWWMPKPEPPGSDTPDPRDALIETLAEALEEIHETCGVADLRAFNQIKDAVSEAVGLSDQALSAHAAWKETNGG